jgi:hypothetical protein
MAKRPAYSKHGYRRADLETIHLNIQILLSLALCWFGSVANSVAFFFFSL